MNSADNNWGNGTSLRYQGITISVNSWEWVDIGVVTQETLNVGGVGVNWGRYITSLSVRVGCGSRHLGAVGGEQLGVGNQLTVASVSTTLAGRAVNSGASYHVVYDSNGSVLTVPLIIFGSGAECKISQVGETGVGLASTSGGVEGSVSGSTASMSLVLADFNNGGELST